MRRLAASILLATVLLVAGAAHAQPQSSSLAPFVPPEDTCHDTTGPLPRPALAAQFADPFVYCAGGRFLVVASNWAGVHIPIAASQDLSSWAVLRDARGAPLDAMPDLPTWVWRRGRPDVWAPEVAHLGDKWVLYFSARHATARTPAGQPRECIGAAVSTEPDRGFKAEPNPLVCGGFAEGVIDPSFLKDGEANFLTFKSDGNCCRLKANIVVAPLTADGLHLAGPIRPMNVFNDRDWEGEIVEAPTLIQHDGRYVLFYSGGLFFTPAYGVAYANCEGPLGPCQKPAENRVLQSLAGLAGPGHQSIFAVDGRSYMAFHALAPGGRPGPDATRQLHIEALTWENGVPRLGEICAAYGTKDATGVQVACPGAPLPTGSSPGSPSPARSPPQGPGAATPPPPAGR